MSDGASRYRSSGIEEFLREREPPPFYGGNTGKMKIAPLFPQQKNEEQMGKSHQKGWVSPRSRKWNGYFRRKVIDPDTNQPKTVSTPVALGPKSEMTKYEAQEKLEPEIRRLTG